MRSHARASVVASCVSTIANSPTGSASWVELHWAAPGDAAGTGAGTGAAGARTGLGGGGGLTGAAGPSVLSWWVAAASPASSCPASWGGRVSIGDGRPRCDPGSPGAAITGSEHGGGGAATVVESAPAREADTGAPAGGTDASRTSDVVGASATAVCVPDGVCPAGSGTGVPPEVDEGARQAITAVPPSAGSAVESAHAPVAARPSPVATASLDRASPAAAETMTSVVVAASTGTSMGVVSSELWDAERSGTVVDSVRGGPEAT
jgi:hypothetical protein